jgi:hypothetical protein
VVEEQLEVEAVDIQEPVADVPETITPLAIHASDLGNFAILYRILILTIVSSVPDATDLPPPVVVDQEEISSPSLETPSHVDTELSEGPSSTLPQRLPHIFGGLLTPELDHAPSTTFDEEQQAPSCLSSSIEPELEATRFVAESSTDIAGQWSHPPTIGEKPETDHIATKSVDRDDVRVISITDSERQGNVLSSDDLLQDTQPPLAGIHYESPTAEVPEMPSGRRSLSAAEERLPSQTFAINDSPLNYTALDSSSPVETLQSDIYVSAPVTTNPIVGNSQEFTVCEEPSLANDVSDGVSEQANDFVATPTVAGDNDLLQAPALPVLIQAEVSVGLAGTSKEVEERQTAQEAQTSAEVQASDETSHPAEMGQASAIEVMNDCATSNGYMNGRFGNGDDGNVTDTREISHTAAHDPVQLPSSAYTLSQTVPSSSYSMRMVMRKATDPVLFVDPYPYSLSTPGQPQDEASDDEETEQENSLSSSSTFDKYSDDKVKESDAITTPNESAPYKDDPELQSPSEPVEVNNFGSANAMQRTQSIESSIPEQKDVDSDTDADGDVDPEFLEVDHTPSSTRSSSTNDLGVVDDPFRDGNVKSSADTGGNKSIQPGGVKTHDEPDAKQQNR